MRAEQENDGSELLKSKEVNPMDEGEDTGVLP